MVPQLYSDGGGKALLGHLCALADCCHVALP